MKRARIIHGIVWAVITLAVIATVVAEWHAQGCSVKSLVLATILYTAMGVGLWGCGDESIKYKTSDSPNPLKEGLIENNPPRRPARLRCCEKLIHNVRTKSRHNSAAQHPRDKTVKGLHVIVEPRPKDASPTEIMLRKTRGVKDRQSVCVEQE